MNDLTPEERAVGKSNFYAAVGSDITLDRRKFLEGTLAAGVVSGAGLGSMYFGYDKTVGRPLRIGFIGTGDEGGVLIGSLTPSFVQVVAIADIRPYNIHRAFHGDHSSETILKIRTGLMKKYGWKSEDEARKHVKVYDGDYKELLADKNVEAVIIALPLHLHAPVAIEAMKAGKHVLTEKLMAHSVHECKEMARASHQLNKILAVGHQRHYSILYDNAVDTIRSGLIGKIHSIRAQWHRDNLPGKDSWQPPLPSEVQPQLDQMTKDRDGIVKALAKLAADGMARDREKGAKIDVLTKRIEQLKAQVADQAVDAEKYGYQWIKLDPIKGKSNERPPIEELIRWRLWKRTGGGLMAELGSHQLDAAGIFISGLRKDGQKALPLNVSAMGQRNLFPMDRECEDHVYCMYEFPGPDYDATMPNPTDKIGVTYSSINGNGFGGYGEVVLGTAGTLILEKEQEVMLFKNAATTTKLTLKQKKDGGAALDTTESNAGPASVGKAALESGPISRGYTEEIEHFAWCIRNPSPENLPRCHPKIALGDAVIALTTNIAMRENRRIEFEPAWFDIDQDATPEGIKPSVESKASPSTTAKAKG